MGRKLFFLEDYAIHEKHNVYRNVSQALKHPEPVMAADRDWEYETVELHQGTVLYCEDEKLFKMWYTTGHGYVRPATDRPTTLPRRGRSTTLARYRALGSAIPRAPGRHRAVTTFRHGCLLVARRVPLRFPPSLHACP